MTEVEATLGYRLPKAYIELCRLQNGGLVELNCHRTAHPTSWASDHVCITNIKGIGFRNIWSLCGDLGQNNAVEGWGYPAIGVYFADCPSAGHDRLCLDYTGVSPDGEPAVVHIDQESDYAKTFVAASFEDFLAGLESEDAFPFTDEEAELIAVGEADVRSLSSPKGWLPMRLVFAVIAIVALVAVVQYFAV